MRRLLFFAIGFVLATVLVFSCGCAVNDPLGIFNELEQELNGEQYDEDWEAEREVGWQAIDQSGNHWVLYVPNDDGVLRIASCDYSYMKIRGVEKWKGQYYGMVDSMNHHGPVFDNDLENLVGCVTWVERFLYGDFYI